MKTIEAPAKINLYLRVLGKRPDGYHDLETLFCEIDLCDRLSWEPGPPPLRLEVRGADLGDPADNLITRAAAAYTAAGGEAPGGRMVLEKNIPAGGGLGGGSSDAAAASRLFESEATVPLGRPALMRIAASIGSDVPFFLVGGCCLGRGRGELLTPRPLPPGARSGLLIFPGIHLSTGSVFTALAEQGYPERSQRLPEIGHNDLLRPALALSPPLAECYGRLRSRLGDSLFMTGSGSTLVWLQNDARASVVEEIAPGCLTRPFSLRER